MKQMFVLNETDRHGMVATLGVFDSPDISDAKLAEYYGEEFDVIGTIDVRDSGIEWQKRILVQGVYVVLNLHYFAVGEL